VLGSDLFPAFGHLALIAVVGIVAVVYLSAEVRGAVKPRSSTNERSAIEPTRPVVAVGSTAVRRGFKVAVGTFRSCADFDTDLSQGLGSACGKAETGDSGQSKELNALHGVTSD